MGSGDSLTSKWVKISIEEAETVGPTDPAAVSSYFAALKSDDDSRIGCIGQTAYHIWPLTDFPPSGEEDGGDVVGSTEQTNDHFGAATFDVLWLSKTEFITRHYVEEEEERDVVALSAITVQVGEGKVYIQAFRAHSPLDNEVPGDASVRFLHDYLTPVFKSVSMIDALFLDAPPPVDATLLLVPTPESDVKNIIHISLKEVSIDMVRALEAHPVHPRVRLRLEGRLNGAQESNITAQEMNDALRAFQHPIHLNIPGILMSFRFEDEIFTANPVLQSLTIYSDGLQPLSPKLLEGIACNSSLNHLAIDATGWTDRHETRWDSGLWAANLVSQVLSPRFANLQSLTLIDDETWWLRPSKNEQRAFDQLTRRVDSRLDRGHGWSSFHLAFPPSWQNPVVKSNTRWDCRFSPSLVLNQLQRQRGSFLSPRVSGMALRSINEGVLYRSATNVVPEDLAASSAGAIFHILRCFVFDASSESTVCIRKKALNRTPWKLNAPASPMHQGMCSKGTKFRKCIAPCWRDCPFFDLVLL
jgi:hypothetical protein